MRFGFAVQPLLREIRCPFVGTSMSLGVMIYSPSQAWSAIPWGGIARSTEFRALASTWASEGNAQGEVATACHAASYSRDAS